MERTETIVQLSKQRTATTSTKAQQSIEINWYRYLDLSAIFMYNFCVASAKPKKIDA